MSLAFLQQVLLAALVFVPLERIYALHKDRKILRDGLLVDVTHLFATGSLVYVGLILLIAGVVSASTQLVPPAWRDAVASQPAIYQFLEIVLLADLGFYAAHRAFHRLPFLWRFHAVHHSIEQLDWIAAHRVHPVDQFVTKGVSIMPVFALGFDAPAILAFWSFYHWQSLLIHSNVRLNPGPLRWLLATPQFHHWHHAGHPQALDRNFAGQVPLWDIIFRTAYMPRGKWPERYGSSDPVPSNYIGQIAYPFFPKRTGSGGEQKRKRPSPGGYTL